MISGMIVKYFFVISDAAYRIKELCGMRQIIVRALQYAALHYIVSRNQLDRLG
jgi:hypothetical protein